MSEVVQFSVVVPSRGDPAKLGLLFASLEAQTFERARFELLLVLDGVDLPSSLAPRLAALGGALRSVERRGPGVAQHRSARGEASVVGIHRGRLRPESGLARACGARVSPTRPAVGRM